jgi:hypothetical protein
VQEGYGLAWNSISEGNVLSCADDRSIALWNVNGALRPDAPSQAGALLVVLVVAVVAC